MLTRKNREKQYRDSLTDSMVKKTIYIQGKGSIKYSDITPEMMEAKRAHILAHRQRKADGYPEPPKPYGCCVVCGEQITIGNSNRTACSDECGREKERRNAFNVNSAKKVLKEHLCNECGKPFTPTYGDKRRGFCSKKCRHRRSVRDGRKNKQKARKYGVAYQYINPKKVFERDGYHCQICGKATPMSRRGTCYPNAPELDHRTPISKGGDHLYANVQCACRSCNGRKSNHNEAGQLPLFDIVRAA